MSNHNTPLLARAQSNQSEDTNQHAECQSNQSEELSQIAESQTNQSASRKSSIRSYGKQQDPDLAENEALLGQHDSLEEADGNVFILCVPLPVVPPS